MKTTKLETIRQELHNMIDRLLSDVDELEDQREHEHGDPVGLRPVAYNPVAVNLPWVDDGESVQLGGQLWHLPIPVPGLVTVTVDAEKPTRRMVGGV